MWFEFFKFDLRFQLRQPLLWVFGLLLGLMAFAVTATDAVQVGGAIGNINRNAPTVIAQFLAVFSVLSMFLVTVFIAGAVLRDSEVGISDMIFATPMKKHDYLLGRFLAGFCACLVIFVLIAIGLMLGPLWPSVDSARVGPFSLQPYLWSFAVLVIPNLLFISALLMLLAATTRSILMVYVGVIVFFSMFTTAGVLMRDLNNEWLGVLFDPFGYRTLARATRYFSVAEANAGLPAFGGPLLLNRALWSTIALLLVAATVYLFKPQRANTGRKWLGKTAALPTGSAGSAAAAPLAGALKLPRHVPQTGWRTTLAQCWQWLCFDAKAVFTGIPFLVMLLLGLANFIGGSVAGASFYGTKIYPVTRVMLSSLGNSYSFLLIMIVVFYGGELIFKERQAKMADVLDAMPIPDWVPLVAKTLALSGVVLGFLLAGGLASMAFQLIDGGVALEPMLYLKGLLVMALPFLLLAWFALVLQVLSNNKYIGYLLMVALVLSEGVLDFLHLNHNLYRFGSASAMPYSDMNGYGHFGLGWGWFNLYWFLFTFALLIVAQAFWVRGLSHEWRVRTRLAAARLKGRSGLALAVCLAGFFGAGSVIFHNTNVLNQYLPDDVAMDRQADYEKLYRKYKWLPHPKITDIKAEVDIFPAERRLTINGHYVLKNKTDMVQDTLRLQVIVEKNVRTEWLNLPPHKVELQDKKFGFSILKLAQPLAPGATLALDFKVDVRNPGFTNKGAPNTLNLNGTFFNNGEFFPQFGYAKFVELADRHERKKRGLGEPERMAKLEDPQGQARMFVDTEADWINFDTTISTSSDQVALAPGYLQKTWEKDGRRYFHYQMDKPILAFFSYLSGNWQVKKGEWHGLPIEIYYDAKHGYNVDRMIRSTQKSLDYFTSQFTPYQFRQVRILEFPGYQSFAQSFANTIPYSEAIGFVADLRSKDDIDYVYYVTAHEMAHQWWGHQVTGGDVQGETMLAESLAQYSALMVMEKEYGRDKMRQFLRYELDRYLRSRGGEAIEEQPLMRVENQQYIHYQKGSLVFYRLRDEIGEVPLNRALKRFLQDKAFQQPPYATSRELINYIRAESPADKQALITDLFEKIVFYDNRILEASAKQRKDGQWDVTMKLHLAKLEADGKGKESKRTWDEPVEVGVFARAKGAKERDEKVLLLEKRVLPGGDSSITVTVKDKPFEVGVDPYNKMIDRVSNDNRKEVSFP
jgi:ABC-type transport system involved in multi-copper enzyme maturation permease subunit